MTDSSDFALSWWSRRWISVLESFPWEHRLQRGQTYARQGAVTSLDIDSGKVRAKVQGSRRQPYLVSVLLRVLPPEAWDSVMDALAARVSYVAQLLSGEMPEDIEDVFQSVKLSLLPRTASDVLMDCTCPDKANPCKHIAAVFYVLGSEFDRDPFLLFHLRGCSRERLMAGLRERWSHDESPSDAAPPPPETLPEPTMPPLEHMLDHFWTSGAELPDLTQTATAPSVELSVLRRLGPFPGTSGIETQAILANLYRAITRRAHSALGYNGEDEGASPRP